MDKDVSMILLLELIRKEGGSLRRDETSPLPLDMLFTELVLTGLLSIGSDSRTLTITAEGKKVLHLFDLERKNLTVPLEPYKEVLVDGKTIDGRIPLLAYTLIGQDTNKILSLLRASYTAIYWKEMIQVLSNARQESASWYLTLSDSELFIGLVTPDAWKQLGKTEEDAKRMGKWLLNPYPAQVQITR